MRTLLATLGFIALATYANAQLSFGIHGGYTLAWENYGDVILPEDAVIHIHGFHASSNITYRLNDRFSLAMEPGFVRRGAACVPGWNGGINPNPVFPADRRYLLDYAELPFQFQMHLSLANGKYELIPSLGYSTAIMLRGTEETIDLETKRVIGTRRLGIGGFGGGWPEVNRLDHGAKAGVKLARNFVSYQLYARTSFYLGIRDADRSTTSKNRAIDLSIGYQF